MAQKVLIMVEYLKFKENWRRLKRTIKKSWILAIQKKSGMLRKKSAALRVSWNMVLNG